MAARMKTVVMLGGKKMCSARGNVPVNQIRVRVSTLLLFKKQARYRARVAIVVLEVGHVREDYILCFIFLFYVSLFYFILFHYI